MLISDNGLQLDSKMFRRYCSELGISNRYSTPAYPQGNGQVKAVNKVIVNGLKKRLDDAKGKCVKELPHVLWTYRTTPRKSTGEDRKSTRLNSSHLARSRMPSSA